MEFDGQGVAFSPYTNTSTMSHFKTDGDIEVLETVPRQRSDAMIDTIDHYPGVQQTAENAAKRAHLDHLDAGQAQAASGTVSLLHRYGREGKGNVMLMPAPTADPQGELDELIGSTTDKTTQRADIGTTGAVHRYVKPSPLASIICHSTSPNM